MSNLTIPLTTITDGGLEINADVDAGTLKPADVPPLPLKDIRVRGTLTPLIGQYLFQGMLEGVFVHPCDRCLESAEFPVSVPVVWTFEEGEQRSYVEEVAGESTAGEEEEEALGVFTFQGTAIDLARPVWDELALAMPTKFICREDCRGLCPVCGENRNSNLCTCEQHSPNEETPATHSGFAGLKDMFPDLPD